MYTMTIQHIDPDDVIERQRSVRNRQCSVYASRIKPGVTPLTIDGPPLAVDTDMDQLPPLPISPRWDSLSNSSHIIGGSPRSPLSPRDGLAWLDSHSANFIASPVRLAYADVMSDSRCSSPTKSCRTKSSRTDMRSPEGVLVENFSRPRKQSIRHSPAAGPEQSAPGPAVPRLANLAPTDLLRELGPNTPQTPPWPRPRRPSASSCQSSPTFSSPLGPPPSVDLPDPRSVRVRNAGPPLTAARPPFVAAPSSTASSPMVGCGAPPPWMAGDELRSSFRSQLTASTAFGTAVTERSSVLTKDSSITSLYANTDEPSLEDVMCMYEKGFADDEDEEDDDDDDADEDRADAPLITGVYPNNGVHHDSHDSHAPNARADDDLVLPTADNRALPHAIATDNLPNPDNHPASAMSTPFEHDTDITPSSDADGPLPRTARSTLDAEIRKSKMIFSSAAFTSSVPALSADSEVEVEPEVIEKRDSGKSLDSDPCLSDHPAAKENAGKPIAVPPPAEPRLPVAQPPLSQSQSSMFRGAKEAEDPGSRDRYGFKKQNQFITREQYDAWNKGYTPYLARRHKKWVAYLKECALMTDRPNRFPPPNAKTKRFVRKGIPPDWRGAAWFYYAGGPAILAKHSGLYEKLLERRAKQVDVEAIERDLHRTFPDNVQFQPSPILEGGYPGSSSPEDEPPIVSSLRRVLHAFAIYNPRIGYCQSLNFLAGLLLLFVETEEQCFWLLNVITIIYLPGTHEMNLEGSKVDLGVLMTELRDTMPGVWDRIGGELESNPTGGRPSTAKSTFKSRPMLRRREVSSLSTERLPPITLCMTAWFMSCYIGTLPIETTLRVWDVFFYEGSKTLFRIALAIFKSGEAEIKAVPDPMEMFGVVQSLPRRMLDANALMETCFKRRNGFGHLSQDAIDERRQERRDKAQQERSQQAQLVGKAATSGNVAEVETENVRRKGTLFGRKLRDTSRPRAAEV
ncbi:hypothetical protein HIM_09288 [Hirsutella minnesotensis 3608]|uniref:Rab-GAP TBC domain-containing protein n=1 Tax=Hirsutella minnesotensis 3608 TaxID=1043627 RepID=A0A0F8A370_9HYPO|nr:hypothetical protein HIM_09288 [Hirsutella minnesotensis 3608]